MRRDLNLDVEIFEVARGPDANVACRACSRARSKGRDRSKSVFQKWNYGPSYFKDTNTQEFDEIVGRWDHAQVPVATLKELIAR